MVKKGKYSKYLIPSVLVIGVGIVAFTLLKPVHANGGGTSIVRFGAQSTAPPYNFIQNATVTVQGVGTFPADATSNGAGTPHSIPDGTYQVTSSGALRDWATNPNYCCPDWQGSPAYFLDRNVNPATVTFKGFNGNMWAYIA